MRKSRFDNHWLAEYIRREAKRQGHSAGARPRPIVQEQQDDRADLATDQKRKKVSVPDADSETREAEVDEGSHPVYDLTVTIRVSDNRRRDLDGNLSTILDCLVQSVRRLAPVAAENPSPG